MHPQLSVIICTHNPCQKYLEKVLEALKIQSLPVESWELILIDNASNELVSEKIGLTWHPNARHLRENNLGLTMARLCGIRESNTDLLIFVDDDNILQLDYLHVALRISKEFPHIGAWGGQIFPIFEEQPPEWTKLYWGYLAIRKFDKDKWTNQLYTDATPCGAGICIRKVVAEKYAYLALNDPKRSRLGRTGDRLLCCEDTDMALTACDLGLGVGQFTALKLHHLMPKKRFQEDYLLRLIEGNGYSQTILYFLRGELLLPVKKTWKSKLLEQYRLWRMPSAERNFYKAWRRGENLAFKELFNN